jgi:hypothetical protein
MHWTVTVPPLTAFEVLDDGLDGLVVGIGAGAAVVAGEPPGDDLELLPGRKPEVVGDDPNWPSVAPGPSGRGSDDEVAPPDPAAEPSADVGTDVESAEPGSTPTAAAWWAESRARNIVDCPVTRAPARPMAAMATDTATTDPANHSTTRVMRRRVTEFMERLSSLPPPPALNRR